MVEIIYCFINMNFVNIWTHFKLRPTHTYIYTQKNKDLQNI